MFGWLFIFLGAFLETPEVKVDRTIAISSFHFLVLKLII